MFKVDGYWKDDKTEFYGYYICEYNDTPDGGGWDDDAIFYYGLSKQSLNASREEDALEFVITSFEEEDV